MKIAFIGLGIMGKPMAKNLLKVGHELRVYDRNQATLDEMKEAGATVCGSSAETADAEMITAVKTSYGFLFSSAAAEGSDRSPSRKRIQRLPAGCRSSELFGGFRPNADPPGASQVKLRCPVLFSPS